jgi:protein-disulfide isomerase
VRVVWKHLPLAMHKNAPAAHQASVAAQKQGKFWEFHDKLFANQRNLKIDAFRQYAEELGLNMEQFEKDLLDVGNKGIVDKDSKEAASMGVTGTPGFFVNGRFLSGAKPFEEFAKLINAELTKRGLPVPPEASTQ